MRSKKHILHSSIRFRRWTRKRYATFCSLGKVISIGHLRCGIAEQSLLKQYIFDNILFIDTNLDYDIEDKEHDSLLCTDSTLNLNKNLHTTNTDISGKISMSFPDILLYLPIHRSEYNPLNKGLYSLLA
ncbi:MAG: hypothetical protein ACRCXN_12645 [Bacteroidales bacterium]